MIEMGPLELAAACGGQLVRGAGEGDPPARAVTDSREVGPGDLFFGIRGERLDGGRFAQEALAAGAWGAVVATEHVARLGEKGGRVIGVADPLKALAELARAWRLRLGGGRCQVVGITGSTGKTSVKDIAAAMLKPVFAVHASRQNLNTEVGLPLAILEADRATDCLILEKAMRGPGQVRELASIGLPQIGVITNVGPVHLELMGSVAAVAQAKAELIAALPGGGACVVPHGAEELRPYMRGDLRTLTFADVTERGEGEHAGAEVRLLRAETGRDGSLAVIEVEQERVELRLNVSQHHNVMNAAIATAIAHALGVPLERLAEGAAKIELSALRGEEIVLPGDILVINDCYNANPMSMDAALAHLADLAGETGSRRVAVLGEMAELGADAESFHHLIGRRAARAGVELLIAVGDLGPVYVEGFDDAGQSRLAADAAEAAALACKLVEPGDAVLVKGSRSIGLEAVAAKLEEAHG